MSVHKKNNVISMTHATLNVITDENCFNCYVFK